MHLTNWKLFQKVSPASTLHQNSPRLTAGGVFFILSSRAFQRPSVIPNVSSLSSRAFQRGDPLTRKGCLYRHNTPSQSQVDCHTRRKYRLAMTGRFSPFTLCPFPFHFSPCTFPLCLILLKKYIFLSYSVSSKNFPQPIHHLWLPTQKNS